MSKGRIGAVYECVRCRATIPFDELMKSPELKCFRCGYHVLRKTRAPIVKRIKAL